MKINNHLSIFIVLVIAFGFSYLINTRVFVANSPKVKPFLGENIVWGVKNALHVTKEFAFFWDRNKPINTANVADYLKTNLKPISKGVKAAEENNVSYTQYNLNDIEYVQTTFTLSNGKVIKIRYPKGISPPPQELFENQK